VVTYRDIEIVDAKLLQEIQRVTRGTWKGALRQGGLSGAPLVTSSSSAARLHA